MKAAMYFNYTSRSLIRGGQRTILAIFCVAVGVMAIVALQLVGQMINNAFTSDVRDANGGDIAVSANSQPFKQSDLSFFDKLKSDGTITSYTPIITSSGSTAITTSLRQTFTVEAVDPQTFPVVTPPTFTAPSDGKFSALLTNNQVVVTQSFVDQYNKKVGDSFDVRAGSRDTGERILHIKIVGIVADSGVFAYTGSTVVVSLSDFLAADTKAPVLYNTIDIATANQAHTDAAVKAIQTHFPIASTQTATDALKSQQDLVDNIKKFLEIAGLLALLIGGVGIVNTMQVLLSRRKIEIAMLKTTGYRRFDLYLLFGLEAGLLGLVGGVAGALAATGVSYLVRNLVQQTFGLNIPFLLDPVTIGGGVLIGLVTALIFGLMPIVQAANIRPLNVIRELPEGSRVGSIFLTIGLLVLLSVLFCGLAIFILNDITLGITAVYGTFIFLALLSVFFGLTVFIVSKLPVPERFSFWYIALIVAAVAISVLIFQALPAFGVLLLIVALMGFVVVLLPRSWKVNTKIALRNIGRQRARTTTTMLALFVGVFTIGLILALGQNLRDQVNNALASSLNFNVVTIVSSDKADALQSKLSTISGLSASRHTIVASAAPAAINGQPIGALLPKGEAANTSPGNLGREGVIALLRGVEGYDVGNNQIPDPNSFTITQGRNLNASDAGTDNVLINNALVGLRPLHMKVGDTITLVSIDGKSTRTVTVVGAYRSKGFSGLTIEPILSTADTVKALTPAGFGQTVFYMKIDPAQASKAVGTIGNIVPDAFVLNLANLGDIIDQILNDILLTLTTIASLSLFAGVIIIANAVALAMLERRRELGILKSVGYTSRSILSEVLIENGAIGATGALLAMLLATLAMNLLGRFVFKTDFGVSGVIAIGLIVGAAVLAMVTAALVAWRATRVRPLEVLRYE
jgi:putative ABC transport system permease protein